MEREEPCFCARPPVELRLRRLPPSLSVDWRPGTIRTCDLRLRKPSKPRPFSPRKGQKRAPVSRRCPTRRADCRTNPARRGGHLLRM
jgi:hypothetical protein